jgi:hypothetical protein
MIKLVLFFLSEFFKKFFESEMLIQIKFFLAFTTKIFLIKFLRGKNTKKNNDIY